MMHAAPHEPRRNFAAKRAMKMPSCSSRCMAARAKTARCRPNFDRSGLAYNGSGAEASHLCMDKNATGDVIRALSDRFADRGGQVLRSRRVRRSMPKHCGSDAAPEIPNLSIFLSNRKPTAVRRASCGWQSAKELGIYLQALASAHQAMLPAGTLAHQPHAIDLPAHARSFMLEPFIVTDDIHVDRSRISFMPNATGLDRIDGGRAGTKRRLITRFRPASRWRKAPCCRLRKNFRAAREST